MRTSGARHGSTRCLFGVATVLLLLTPCSASAQYGPDMDRCDPVRRDATPAERIEACSIIIDSRRTEAGKRAVVYIFRAVAFRQNKEYARAIADHDEAIRLDPRSAAAFKERGLTWQRQKEYDRGIQ